MTTPSFPSLPGLGYPVKRGIKWELTKQDALSGKRIRLSYFTYPIYEYEVVLNFLRSDSNTLEWQTFVGFVNSLAGGTGLFLYDDPNDNTATAQTFGTGDGVTTTFQLVRSLGSFVEPVFFPTLSGGLVTQVTDNGSPTTAYTVSATGQIIFNSAPAAGHVLAWTGMFSWGCRFDDDVFGLMNDFLYNGAPLWSLKSLKFSSEKLP